MTSKLFLHFTSSTETALVPVRESLRSALPQVEVLLGEAIVPARSSFDTFRKQHDAAYLLQQIPPNTNDFLTLWIVSEDLFAPGKVSIFGASGERKAIVSTFMLDTMKAVGNVAVHEVCHMLGLSHCSRSCIMLPVRTSEQAEKRPLSLCSTCRNELDKKNVARDGMTIAEKAVV